MTDFGRQTYGDRLTDTDKLTGDADDFKAGVGTAPTGTVWRGGEVDGEVVANGRGGEDA